jgi:putative ABC transport system substrate-binding protein
MIQIEYRWGAGNIRSLQLLAKELIGLNPDVLVSVSTPATAALKAETHRIPIVFAMVSDPVGIGFVTSFANPGGNITGFYSYQSFVERQVARTGAQDRTIRVACAFLYDPQTAPYAQYYLDKLGQDPLLVTIRSYAPRNVFATFFSVSYTEARR